MIYILDLFTYILFNIIIHKFIYHDYVNDETFIGIFYIDWFLYKIIFLIIISSLASFVAFEFTNNNDSLYVDTVNDLIHVY